MARRDHHLERLLLGSNRMEDAGVRQLCDALRRNGKTKLRKLGLSNNGLTDVAGLKVRCVWSFLQHAAWKHRRCPWETCLIKLPGNAAVIPTRRLMAAGYFMVHRCQTLLSNHSH